MDTNVDLFTIGHSNHDIKAFIDLLRRNSIARVVDVRSAPYSRYSPHFNKQALEAHLSNENIEYVHLGQVLGGRPEDPACFDEAGELDYRRVAEQPWFQHGLNKLLDLARADRTTIMCSEEDPRYCHRNLLISDSLLRLGDVRVSHIRGSGETEPADLQPRQSRLF